jgi:DNA-directed RNA polymerase specialized sigma subunit
MKRISIKKKILDLISQIPGVEGEVLKLRYVDGEIWEDICEDVSYSWQGVFKIHKRALRMVQDLLDQGDLFDT